MAGGMMEDSLDWVTEREPETVHRVCHLLRGSCNDCPARVTVDERTYTRGCYLKAVEIVNTVETGNPWRKTVLNGLRGPWVVRSPWPESGTS